MNPDESQLQVVGRVRLLAITANDHYDVGRAAAYWFEGEEQGLKSGGKIRVLAFAIVEEPSGKRRYALARSEVDSDIVMDGGGCPEVVLLRDSKKGVCWFRALRPGVDDSV